MGKFRVLLQGEGISPTTGWFGLYAARQIQSADKDAAAARAVEVVRGGWGPLSESRGELQNLVAVAVWPAPPLSWRSLPAAGHTFYNDDAEAQVAALHLEARMGRVPRRLLNELLNQID